jgi:serine/threonine-protein kinase
MRLLEKVPAERYANATDVIERLQRELRALTRDDPASVVRSALVESGSAARSGIEAGNRPLELLPEQAGGLRVIASPWAYVRVDGQLVETTPFARPIPLSPGQHWITLSHPDAPPVEREITVATNETVTLDVTMALGNAEDAGKDAR